MSKQYVFGVDPGKTGGAVVIDFNRKIYHRQHFDDLTEDGLMACLRSVAAKFRPVMVKEIFIPNYGNSNAAFVSGRYHALIDLVAREHQLRKIETRASEWQRALLPREQDNLKVKYSALLRARELFEGEDFRIPLLKKKLSKNEHQGLIDAALLAVFGVNLLVAEMPGHSEA